MMLLDMLRLLWLRFQTQRGGVAMAMLLSFFGLAVPIAVASVVTAGQFARGSLVFNDRLDRMHCNGAGMQHAIWRIKHEAGFVDSLTEDVPYNYSLDQCGMTLQLIVTGRPTSTTGVKFGAVDYTVPAGHQIEIKITVETTSDDDVWIAYDTVDQPSWVKLPSPEHGDKVLKLHNDVKFSTDEACGTSVWKRDRVGLNPFLPIAYNAWWKAKHDFLRTFTLEEILHQGIGGDRMLIVVRSINGARRFG